MKKITLFALLLALQVATPAFADYGLSLSTQILGFDYEEFDKNTGSTLNHENGFIPGIKLALSRYSDNLSNNLSFEYFDGRVDYDGLTQALQPHVTKTDETIYRLGYRLATKNFNSQKISYYTSIAYQIWDRDILPNNGVSGLFERYQWWIVEAGIQSPLYSKNRQSIDFELGFSRTTGGEITINLKSSGFGEPTLSLGDKYGIRSALFHKIALENNALFVLGIEHRLWKFGRSETSRISNGFTSADIEEPRSTSNHTALSASYIVRF